ncbi:MAG: SMC-Scp complex subunit ScpB, partial [Bacteroidota bacterium]
LEKDLIVISGKSDGPGRPILYATSKNFMDHFGLRSVKDLPKLKDIQPGAMSEIGIPLEMMEEIPVDLAPEQEGEALQEPEVSFDNGIQDDVQEPENEGSDQSHDEQQ